MRDVGCLLGDSKVHRKVFVISALFFSACSNVATHQRPDDYYSGATQRLVQAPEAAPLFKGDEKVIADEDIKRILDYRYEFPARNRIAILPLGQRAWWSTWSNEFAVMNDQMEKDLIAALRRSKRIFDASYVPSFLVPERRTVPYLREAAARYQADLMLLYRSDCKTYEKFRMFSANETKAFCTVETALLDVRTGVIPFTSVTTETFEAKKTDQDTNFAETVHKAEIEAIGKALLASANNLVVFIDAPPE